MLDVHSVRCRRSRPSRAHLPHASRSCSRGPGVPVRARLRVGWRCVEKRALRIVFCDPRWVPQPNPAVTLHPSTLLRACRAASRHGRALSLRVSRESEVAANETRTAGGRVCPSAPRRRRQAPLKPPKQCSELVPFRSSRRLRMRVSTAARRTLAASASPRSKRSPVLSPLRRMHLVGPDLVGITLPPPVTATGRNALPPHKRCARGSGAADSQRSFPHHQRTARHGGTRAAHARCTVRLSRRTRIAHRRASTLPV
jgi:hypothetical protein